MTIVGSKREIWEGREELQDIIAPAPDMTTGRIAVPVAVVPVSEAVPESVTVPESLKFPEGISDGIYHEWIAMTLSENIFGSVFFIIRKCTV